MTVLEGKLNRIYPTILAWFGFALILVLYIRAVLYSGFDHDEIEHAHVLKQVANGLVPYRDFPQNHFPMLWLISYPFIHIFINASDLLVALRLFQLIPLVGLFTILWLNIPQRDLSLRKPLYFAFGVLFLFYTQWIRFRPDPWAVVSMIGAVALLQLPIQRVFIAGICASLSLLFTPKLFLIAALVPVLICMDKNFASIRSKIYGVGSYSIGFSLLPGFTFIGLYLFGILPDFYRECIEFNQVPLLNPWQSFFALQHPILLGAVAILIWVWVCEPWPNLRDGSANYLLVLLILAGTVTTAFHNSSYQLQAVAGFFIVYIATTSGYPRRYSLAGVATTVFVAWSAGTVLADLYKYHDQGWTVTQEDYSWLNATVIADDSCFGLSPYQPIYCKQVVTLSRGWDMGFLHHPNPIFRQLQKQYVEDSLRKITKTKPNYIVAGYNWFDPFIDLTSSTSLDACLRQDFGSMLSAPYYERIVSPHGLILFRKRGSH